MKLLLMGVFTPNSTNIGMAEALRALGHEVIALDYRAAMRKFYPDGIRGFLSEATKEVDVTVLCKGFAGGQPPIEPEWVADWHGTTCYWFPDTTDIHGILPCRLAAACTYQCATSLVSCRAFENAGCKNVSQVFEGFDPGVFKPYPVERKRGVVFAGSVDFHRQSVIDALECSGIPVERVAAWGADLARVYSEAKIVLNVTRGEIFGDRVVQTMACGAMCLSEGCADLATAFELGAEWGTWGPWHTIPVAARYWLERDAERVKMAEQAHKAVQRFTWNNQMQKLVAVLKGDQILDGAFLGRDHG